MKIMIRLHRWTSVICTVFLLLLILTGLPLMFRQEIRSWNTINLPAPSAPMAVNEIWSSLDEGLDALQHNYPDKELLSVTPDPSDGTLYFRVKNKNERAARAHMRMGGEQIMYDVREHTLFDRTTRVYRYPAVEAFLHTMHNLHVSLGTGSTGRNILILMCFLSIVSLFSGLYLYFPMMKAFAFGTVRRRTKRLWWSDWHKILSLVAAAWLFALCMSGIAIDLYARGSMQYDKTAAAQAKAALVLQDSQAAISPMAALEKAQAFFPDRLVISMDMPNKDLPAYTFSVADVPAQPTNFMLGEKAFLAKDGASSVAYYPAPAWMQFIPFWINLHIHSHDLMIEKILWVVLILISVGAVVTGIGVFISRQKAQVMRAAKDVVQARHASLRRETWLVVIGAMAFLVLPIYGGFWHVLALLLAAALFIWLWRSLRK
ncbi:PepSY-associated TM helix domain-containing protein [Mitsuokella jalaludinii]|uniref:PepSY-associated TM helix domain-containing protein n=1 Tax=Mitsuokella jalaludinii TaxID=187979 RepID=UPI0029E267F3|nr:PepSY-associated TM helix domain-containing protein [Selenomonadaceae bacterium]